MAVPGHIHMPGVQETSSGVVRQAPSGATMQQQRPSSSTAITTISTSTTAPSGASSATSSQFVGRRRSAARPSGVFPSSLARKSTASTVLPRTSVHARHSAPAVPPVLPGPARAGSVSAQPALPSRRPRSVVLGELLQATGEAETAAAGAAAALATRNSPVRGQGARFMAQLEADRQRAADATVAAATTLLQGSASAEPSAPSGGEEEEELPQLLRVVEHFLGRPRAVHGNFFRTPRRHSGRHHPRRGRTASNVTDTAGADHTAATGAGNASSSGEAAPEHRTATRGMDAVEGVSVAVQEAAAALCRCLVAVEGVCQQVDGAAGFVNAGGMAMLQMVGTRQQFVRVCDAAAVTKLKLLSVIHVVVFPQIYETIPPVHTGGPLAALLIRILAAIALGVQASLPEVVAAPHLANARFAMQVHMQSSSSNSPMQCSLSLCTFTH